MGAAIFETYPLPWKIVLAEHTNFDCGYGRRSDLIVDSLYDEDDKDNDSHVVLIMDPSEGEYAWAISNKDAQDLVEFVNKAHEIATSMSNILGMDK